MLRFMCFLAIVFVSIVDTTKAQGQITFDVLVLDDYTLRPLNEAQVTLFSNGTSVLSTHTGPDGIANITLTQTSAENRETEVPNSFALSGNYPNPFNTVTKAELSIPKKQGLTIEVFNILGQRIATEQRNLAAGYHTLNLNLAHLPTGVYLLRVSGEESRSIKLLKTGISGHHSGPVLSVQPGQNQIRGVSIAKIAEVESYSLRVTKQSYEPREITLPDPVVTDPDETLDISLSRNNRVTFIVEQGTSGDTPEYKLSIRGVNTEIMTTTPDEIELRSGFYLLEGYAFQTYIDEIIEIVSADTIITLEAPWIPPDDGRSSIDRIAEALDDGDIDDETALIYRVFASFNDPRLPVEYRGDDSKLFSDKSLMEAMHRFDDLSQEARETLGSFLVPPFYAGSWWDLRYGASGLATGSEAGSETGKAFSEAAEVPPCNREWTTTCAVSDEWTYIDGANIRYWYRECLKCDDEYREIERRAEKWFLNFVENTWERLSELGLKEPLPDHVDPRTGQPLLNHGGDPKLDVIRLSWRDLNIHGMAVSYTGRYEETPAWIVFKSTAFDVLLSLAALIHELMHAFQFAYDLHVHHTNYSWMMEATANWAIDYIQPHIQQEHMSTQSFLNTPYRSLDDTTFGRNYGAYLWFYYLSKTHDPSIIKEVFDRIPSHSSLQANELAIRAMRNSDKGFQETFPGFPVLNLNRDDIPQTRQYRVWDYAQPQLNRGVPTTPESLTLGGGLDNQTATLMYDVKYLAAEYTHFQFDDPNIRSVAFFNGYSTKLDLMAGSGLFMSSPLHEEQSEGLDVQALVKIQGQGWKLQDWTGKPVVAFCRELGDQKIEEVIIIHSNSLYSGVSENYPEATWRGNQQPQVHYSNMACARWTGTLAGVIPGDLEERVHLDVTFEALPYPDIHEESAHFGLTYALVDGTLDWEISGTQEGCTVHGQASGIQLPKGRIMATHNFVPTGGGDMFARKAWFNIAWDPVPVTEYWTCSDETYEFERTVGSVFWVHITETEVDQAGQTITGSEEEYNHWGVNWTWHLTSEEEMIKAFSQ